jgi:ribosomal protein L7/L12
MKTLTILAIVAIVAAVGMVGTVTAMSMVQTAHADAGGVPNAHAGENPFKVCLHNPQPNKCL